MNVFSQFSALPIKTKVFILLLVVLLIWFLKTKTSAFKKSVENKITQKSEIQVLAASGIKPSYTPEYFKKMAQGLYDSMDPYGTDEERIFKIFSYLHNNADFIELDKAFGIRYKLDVGLFGANLDVRGWLKEELSSSDIALINSKLKLQGVTKQI